MLLRNAKILFLLLACVARPVFSDETFFCPQASEEEFRSRLHDEGVFPLYDQYGVINDLVDSGFQDFENNEVLIEKYKQDAAMVSQLLSYLDETFPDNAGPASKLYNKLSIYDGTSVTNPDGSRFILELAPATKKELIERFESIQEPDKRKLAWLKFRYSIVSLGVYLDNAAENLRADQLTRLQNIKEMAKQSTRLRWQLSSYCFTDKKMTALYRNKSPLRRSQ